MRDFQQLIVWQKAHRASIGVYHSVATFPRGERFELSSQLRRAAVSVEANIAEACGHHSDREVARFFQMAMASASELQCEILLARDLALMNTETAESLISLVVEVKRMLATLLSNLRKKFAVG